MPLCALTFVAHPLLWGDGFSMPWFIPAGVALAAIAWFGPRVVVAVAAGGFMAVAVAWLRSGFAARLPLLFHVLDVPFSAAEAVVAWELYRRARGTRALADPRSAILFLLLVPGVVALGFAVVRTGLAFLLLQRPDTGLAVLLAEFWLGRALALASLTPPLLIGLTPFFIRRGLTTPEVVEDEPVSHRGTESPNRTRGDLVEIAGLAIGAGLLSFQLCLGSGVREPASWQLWGPPLLLIVWSGVRQGMLGGTLAAGVATALPLFALTGAAPTPALFLLEGNLLAECAAALLVSASSTWIRLSEARYRRVVGQVPVVLYSARITDGPVARTPRAEITLASAASRSIFECPPEDLLGDYEQWLARVHPLDREILLAAVSQLTRQKQPVACEYRLRLPDSSSEPTVQKTGALPVVAVAPKDRWVRDTLAPQFDSLGQLIGWEGVVVDVTEQRALADDLRQTSNMFHTLVANLPAGVVFVQGTMGRPVMVNMRARQLLGRREEVSAGVDHFSEVYRLQRPDGSPYPVEELPVVQALRLGRPASCDDVVVLRPDGRRVPLVTWAAPVELGGHGRDAAAVWVLQDMTALHQAEAARRDSEGRLRAVVEAMAEGLIVFDRRGMVMDCNSMACSLLGETADRLRGRAVDDLPWRCVNETGAEVAPDDRPWHVVLRSGRPVRNTLLGFSPTGLDGRPSPVVRWVLVNTMPLGMGTPNGGAVTTFSDVTAFRKAQEGVRLSEEKYRTLVESMPFMLIQADVNGRVVYANPATRESSGYEATDFTDPDQWKALLTPDSAQQAKTMLAKALAGHSSRGEIHYRDKSGKERVAYAVSQPVWTDGTPTGVTCLLLDVTRERHLEQELERARRLELIGRLASGVAHDFNNLLTVVLGMSQLAGAALPPDHPVHADLRQITVAAEQASNLASQLLTFAKQRSVERRRVDVNTVARRTLVLLRGMVRDDIMVMPDLCPGELPIEADDTQMQQVLMNLCLNARDAMPRGGTLHVRTERDNRGEWARLTVQDEGEGMTEQVKCRLFDAFFTTKEKGTGLGLAVVQQVVESFGGRIEVHSEPGRGARFDVWLPIKRADS